MLIVSGEAGRHTSCLQALVLRITWVADDSDRPCLKVEGRLVGEWVAVLEAELERATRTRSSIALDLTAVEFASVHATQMLRTARARGVHIAACSPLLAQLLSDEP